MAQKDSRLYGKFTLDFPDNYKILPLSDAAFRCLVEATLWSRKQMSDGLLARRYALAKWGADVLAELATNDPENPSLIEVEEGWVIRDFAEHQDTRAEIEARSARNKAAGQRGGLARAKRRAKRVASTSLSESLPETETETETTSTHVGKTTHVSNARKRESSSTFSDGTPIPDEPPADPDEHVIVVEIVPTEIGTAARPTPVRAEPAHRTTVRMILGDAGYPQATVDQLARQVAKLAGKHPPDLIAEALREWDRRPNVKPSYLPSVLGDVVKSRRARPVAPKSTTDERIAAAQALKTSTATGFPLRSIE